jgi:hypothetical protein
VETTTDLGAGRNQVPALQHYNADFLLHRKVLRPSFQRAALTGANELCG